MSDKQLHDDELTVRLVPYRRPLEIGAEHAVVMFEATHEESEARQREEPVNLVVLLDVSNSMSWDDKLESALDTLRALVDHLGPRDTFSLITFSRDVRVLIDAVKMNASAKSLVSSTLSGIRVQGGTNIADALLVGFEIANKTPDSPGHVILLTDGTPTRGILDEAKLISISKKLREVATLSTFGYGGDVSISMLAGLAEAGHGRYHFIESRDAPVDAFAVELGRQRGRYGFGVRLRLTPGVGVKVGHLPGFLRTERYDDGRVDVHLPMLIRGGTQQLAVTLLLSADAYDISEPSPWLKVRLSYRSAEDGTGYVVERAFVPLLAEQKGELNPHVVVGMVLQFAADLLEQADSMSVDKFASRRVEVEKLAMQGRVEQDERVMASIGVLRQFEEKLKSADGRRDVRHTKLPMAAAIYSRYAPERALRDRRTAVLAEEMTSAVDMQRKNKEDSGE